MKRKKRVCKSVIIDLRKISKKSFFLSFLFILIILIYSGVSLSLNKFRIHDNTPKLSDTFISFIKFFTGFKPNDLSDMLESEFPEIGVYKKSSLWKLSENVEELTVPVYNPEGADIKDAPPPPPENNAKSHPIKAIDTSQAKNLSDSGKKILIKNETSYTVDVSKMLEESLPFTFSKTEPEILILHTHGTESYTPEGDEFYSTSQSDRTQDLNKNVVKVGECMAEIFKENGIKTIHDTTLHDYPNYNGSYSNSLKTGKSYLEKYPSIKMIIDVHRDAIVYSDGTKAKAVTEIDGKKAAQLMFVIGTNAGGLEHPEWKKNLQLAVKLQNSIELKYPGLMRGINLRKERFNEHLTTGSMILEVGTSGNTLNEAIYGVQCAAKVIADTLSQNNH